VPLQGGRAERTNERKEGKAMERKSITEAQGPLQGMRVMLTGVAFAGPAAARWLGDMGAEIIKIEVPGVGDTSRIGRRVNEAGSVPKWISLGRNMNSFEFNMNFSKAPESRQVFCDLVKECDIWINSVPSIGKHGATDELAQDANPRLVIVHVTGFGLSGEQHPGLAAELLEQRQQAAELRQRAAEGGLPSAHRRGGALHGHGLYRALRRLRLEGHPGDRRPRRGRVGHQRHQELHLVPLRRLLVAAFALGAAIKECGLLERVSIILLRLFPKSFSGQVLGLLAVTTVTSPIIPSKAAKCSILSPLVRGMSEAMGYKNEGREATGLFLFYCVIGLAGMYLAYFVWSLMGIWSL
jgi:hypothetical protein